MNQAYAVVSSYGIRDVPSHWFYATSLNFYRELSGNAALSEFQHGSPPYPADKQAYVLYYPEDRAFIERQGLRERCPLCFFSFSLFPPLTQ